MVIFALTSFFEWPLTKFNFVNCSYRLSIILLLETNIKFTIDKAIQWLADQSIRGYSTDH